MFRAIRKSKRRLKSFGWNKGGSRKDFATSFSKETVTDSKVDSVGSNSEPFHELHSDRLNRNVLNPGVYLQSAPNCLNVDLHNKQTLRGGSSTHSKPVLQLSISQQVCQLDSARPTLKSLTQEGMNNKTDGVYYRGENISCAETSIVQKSANKQKDQDFLKRSRPVKRESLSKAEKHMALTGEYILPVLWNIINGLIRSPPPPHTHTRTHTHTHTKSCILRREIVMYKNTEFCLSPLKIMFRVLCYTQKIGSVSVNNKKYNITLFVTEVPVNIVLSTTLLY